MRIYIIILNYNTWQDTVECVESILKSNYDNCQIIIVDNNSLNDSVERIKEWSRGGYIVEPSNEFHDLLFPLSSKPLALQIVSEIGEYQNLEFQNNEIILIRSQSNNGFAAGNNIGIDFAKKQHDCSFIWLLNNDTIVTPETLPVLVNSFSVNTKHNIGILGSKLFYYDEPKILQGRGARFNPWTACIYLIDAMKNDENNYSSVEKTDYAIGASMFVSKDFIDDVGPLNESYFLYYEELDWSIRALRKGWNTYNCNISTIYHKQGKTTQTGARYKNSKNLEIEKLKYINLIKLYRNYFPNIVVIAQFRVLAKALQTLLKMRFSESKMILSALIESHKK